MIFFFFDAEKTSLEVNRIDRDAHIKNENVRKME
jgi:hypothetical protein